MLFNSFYFVVFFFVFFVVYNIVQQRRRRLWVITLFSLFFYGVWNYRFLPLLLATGMGDYWIARAIHRTEDERRRRRLLVLSITINLVVLGVFKYSNFFLATSGQLLHALGINVAPPVLNIILPLGISFYTFQSISFVIDVYRRTYQPPERALPFLASLVFFPHLVAGPIVRSSYLVPQFEKITERGWETIRRGFLIVGIGLAKKTIADLLAPTVARVFDVPGHHSMLASWTGVIAFAAQIFGDFSGYTDMAIGLAAIVGFDLPGNFELPFLATSPVDFWTRWHISLSQWLRDYLYVPLLFRLRRLRNPYLPIVLTMVLAGLWHGPSWTYICFGLYHGLLLALANWIGGLVPDRWRGTGSSVGIRVVKTAFNFYLVAIGFIFFRSGSMGTAFSIIGDLHVSSAPSSWDVESRIVLGLVLAALLFGHLLDYAHRRFRSIVEHAYVLWPVSAVAYAASIALPIASGFIYFQF